MWNRIAAFLIKYRIILLVILFAATGVMGFFASKVQLSYEFTNAIPTDNPKYQDYQDFRKQFGEDGNMMVMGVQTDKFFEQSFFTDYIALVEKLKKVPAVTNIISIPGAASLTKDTVTGKIVPALLVQPGTVPDAAAVGRKLYDMPFYKGFLYNARAHCYLMAIRIDKDVLNSKNRTKVVTAITDIGDSFGKAHDIEMHYSGLPLIRTKMAAQVQSEMRLFLIMSFVLTGVILFLFFRSIIAVLASLLVVAVGVVWSVGTIVLLGYKITLLTALIPPLIVVIGIPNCVYFLNKYHSEYFKTRDKKSSLLEMVNRMGVVTLFTNLTAAIGFGVFFFTKSVLLKEFGLVAGLNIIAVFFISLIFIPTLFSFLPPPDVKHTSYLESKWMQNLLNALVKWVFRHRPTIYVATIAVCILAVMGMMRLKNVGHVVDDLPKSEKVYKDLKFFESNFGGVMPLEIIVDTKKKYGATFPATLTKMDSLTAYLQHFPEIGHILCVSEGIKFAYQGLTGGDSNSYVLPDPTILKAVGAEVRKGARNRNPNADNNDLNKLLNSFMDRDLQKTRISIQMKDVGSVRLPQMLDSIAPYTLQLFDTAHYKVSFTGTSVVFLEGSKFIINSLRDSLIYAFLMIFGCMILLFRSWRILLISVVVNIVPLLVTAGIMGWVNIPIKPSTVLVFSVALGITIDVTIRFLVNFKQELATHDEDIAETVKRTIHDTGQSIIYTSLILIAGFGVFALSSFDGTKSLGYLTSLTLLLAMVTNLTLQPALLLWMSKAKNNKKVPDIIKDADVKDAPGHDY